MKLIQSRRGRPQKFGRPSRAVTLTLPDDVIAALGLIDDDAGRAVVRLCQPLIADVGARPGAELSPYGDNAVIVITPIAALEHLPGVALVPLSDGRALISLDETTSVHELELKIRDALEGRALTEIERSTLGSIAEILRAARSTRGVGVHLRSIIVLQSPKRRRFANA